MIQLPDNLTWMTENLHRYTYIHVAGQKRQQQIRWTDSVIQYKDLTMFSCSYIPPPAGILLNKQTGGLPVGQYISTCSIQVKSQLSWGEHRGVLM